MQSFRTLRFPSRPITPLSKRQNVCSVSRQPKTSTRTISTPQRPSLRPLLSKGVKSSRRTFGLPSLSSLLPSNGNNGNNSPHRVLTATRNLPYNPALLYKVIASVESYSQFLPFLTASTVTARDSETGYPTQAFLTVGYGPLSETFTSRVDCDVEKLTVEAKSGDRYGKEIQDIQASKGSSGLSGFFPGGNEGLFEYLSTRWELVPLSPAEAQSGPMTKVNLEVRFEFRSQMHATIMSTVEGQMAGVMIEAFEKRIREVEGKGL
jgi:coenzyme Q-binding protein COQ10